MTTNRRWFQFRIGTVLLWMMMVALAVGWWIDRQQLRSELQRQIDLLNEIIVTIKTEKDDLQKLLLKRAVW